MPGRLPSNLVRELRRQANEPTARFTTLWVAGALLAFSILPQEIRGDDAVRAVALRQLGDGIMPDTKYSMVQMVVSLPLYLILRGAGLGERAITSIPLIWLAVWCVVVWKITARYRSSAVAHHTVVLGIASLVGAYVVGFSSDVFTALTMSGGLLAGLLSRSTLGRAAGWLALAVGAANTPVMPAAVGLIAVLLVLATHRLRYLALPLGPLAVMTAESTWVSGELSWTRYSASVERGNLQLLPWGEVVGFGWPLWSGLLAVLFSFGRGLIFYIPLIWVGPSRKSDELARVEWLLWLAAAALVPIYATWWAWYGGVSFGPRFFMLATVPSAMSCALAISRRDRSIGPCLVQVGAILLSSWVAVSGAIFGVTTLAFDTCVSGGYFTNEALCLYTPEYSGLWAPLWVRQPLGRRHILFAGALGVFVLPSLWAAARPLLGHIAPATVRAWHGLRRPWQV